MAVAAALQAELQSTVESLREIQAETQKHHRARQQFQQQQHENEMVLKELELLDDDAKVYKQIGPALVHQDHLEATSNVSKRLEFIGVEMKRIDEKLAILEEKARKKAGNNGEITGRSAKDASRSCC
ncbi:hypothetical protein Ndes2437A_g02381 [Nannochloris sp. 'desiccata']|nr:hypothetical protein KSW81_001365 [Chlorella desiccata (nom. nud.)]